MSFSGSIRRALVSSSRSSTSTSTLLPILRSYSSSSSFTVANADRISRFQKNAFRSRGFASSARVAEEEVTTPIVTKTILEETTKPEIVEPILEIIPEGALPITDSISIPAPIIELPTVVEELVDAANIAVVNLSGTLDLSSLEGSWGLHPIMRFQSLFINLHESFPLLGHGLPWYILIPTVTLGLRLLLFTFQVRAQSNAARMAIIQPQMLAGMEKLKAAKARGDFMGAQTAQIETQTLMAVNNVNPIKNLAFPLAQAAVFMTMFFALKGLAGAGIPTLATEGLGWVQNLAEPDPYWVLPIASTTLTLATLELGVDSSTQVQTSTTKNMKLFFRVMLVFALPFIAYFPAALLLYWVSNNSISLIQALLLKQPAVRSFFGIPTIPPKKQPGEIGYVPEPSFSEAFKNVQIGMSEKWEETKEKGEKEAIRQKAFADASAGIEKAPVYAPRIPMKKPNGKVQQVSESLTEEFRQSGINPVALTPREVAINLFEEQKRKRAAAVRSRKGGKK